MKIKSVRKIIFYFFLILLLLLPIGLIYKISTNELKEYQPNNEIIIKEMSYGPPSKVERIDVLEYFTISGKIVSNGYEYMELNEDISKLRLTISEGDEIQIGQIIGSYNNQPLQSTVQGVVDIINMGSDPYIRIESITDLVLESSVNDNELKYLERDGIELKTEDGASVAVKNISKTKNVNGGTTIRLHIDNNTYVYGQTLDEIKIFTGREFSQVLALDKDCVYQEVQGEGQPYYVRIVTEDGYFKEEVEVNVGFSNDKFICVTGLEEGTFCDSGYKVLVEGM